MIHSVTANKDTFHSVTFQEGLNLIVAERHKKSTDTNTRNGLGKTTLFRIIDFCLGSDVNKPGTLKAKYLKGQGWEFTVELDIREQRVRVTRAIDDAKVVRIVGDVSHGLFSRTRFRLEDSIHILSISGGRSLDGPSSICPKQA